MMLERVLAEHELLRAEERPSTADKSDSRVHCLSSKYDKRIEIRIGNLFPRPKATEDNGNDNVARDVGCEEPHHLPHTLVSSLVWCRIDDYCSLR